MELRHLRYFVAIAEELHFGRAARRLHIAQSPLSQQIRQLEKELGVELFARTTRKVELTAAGGAFLRHARRALSEASMGAEAAQRAARGELGVLRVGFVDSAAYKLLPRLLPAFHVDHPDVGVELRELTTLEQLDRLGTEIDVGIVRDADASDEVRLTPLITERLIVAVPLRHPLADRAEISLSELSGDHFIVFPRARVPESVDRFVELCRSCGFSPKIGQLALQHATVLGLVETGYGVALLPDSVRDSTRPGIAMLDLAEPHATTRLSLLEPLDRATPLSEAFKEVALAVTAS